MVKQMAVTFITICTIVMLFAYLFQRRVIYLPPPSIPNLKNFSPTDMRDVTLHTNDGLNLLAWYKPALNNQPTVLYLHGNASNIGFMMPQASQFIEAGFGVLLLEYRGYGGNKGSPTELGLYSDGRAGVRFLEQHGVQSNKLVIYGVSLGTGVATKLAVEYPSCAVVLQSPFTSLTAVAQYRYPWLFIKPWDQYDSLGRIDSINAPLLILHGKEDTTVPYQQGLDLYRHAREPKKMLTFEHGNHQNLWSFKGYANDIIHFIRANCIK